MLNLEIDGRALEVAEGSTVIDAAHAAGIYIPHFCYHKKLSIAANCRMCLVQVEKAPKPMPACATPVTNGMKVFTHSELAVKAQQGVMEFLLMNHPLDCPICDQGGECQLQDLAVGYGNSSSRFEEEKRVVMNKNLGPLVSTDMTRCINCTRCVRFTQEIAGFMELGQAYRGDRAEIMPFVEKTVDSELSGNIIDLCPVGALTSKPFRFSARTWEMSRRRSVAPHDGLGSNVVVQTKHEKVLRVLPIENEDINECWLSDRDRFSYEALNSAERLHKPMVKQGGQWQEVPWNVALDYVSHAFGDVAKRHGAAAIGALVSPQSTLEEMFLAQKLLRGVGSDNVDFRLRQADFSADGQRKGTPWLGMPVADISRLDRVLVVGGFLRKDHPLIAQRLRQAAKKGAQVSVLDGGDVDPLIKLQARASGAPSQLPGLLAQVVKAAATAKGVACDLTVNAGAEASAIAESLVSGQNVGVLLGNLAQRHPQGALLQSLANQLASIVGGRAGVLAEAANTVGGYVAKAVPAGSGLNANAMLQAPRQAYLLVGAEPDHDFADGALARSAMEKAATVAAITAFKSPALMAQADVLLPAAPFAETSGTYVSMEGRVQSFVAVAAPQGEARPGWKILRVLGNLLGVAGMDYESSEQIRSECLGGEPAMATGLDNGLNQVVPFAPVVAGSLERVADIPPQFADALVRRAASLQRTKDAAAPKAGMSATTLTALGLNVGDRVKVTGQGSATLVAALDKGVPGGCVRVAGGHADTAALGALFGNLKVERA